MGSSSPGDDDGNKRSLVMMNVINCTVYLPKGQMKQIYKIESALQIAL